MSLFSALDKPSPSQPKATLVFQCNVMKLTTTNPSTFNLFLAVNLSKAFNRLDHSKLLTLLHDVGVPPCTVEVDLVSVPAILEFPSEEAPDGEAGEPVESPRQAPYCVPTLDMLGLCHCAHPPFLPPLAGHMFPKCREPCLRLLYIDDALLATSVRLDRELVPLLPTLGPHGQLESCGLGLPGEWNSLQHRLRDIEAHSSAIGMVLNEKKTNLFIINPAFTRQAVPFIALHDRDPLPIVKEMRLLGLVAHDK